MRIPLMNAAPACFSHRGTMPLKTAITVVLVTHNRPVLLQEALKALAMQSHQPFQVIVVDNASGSDTGRVLDLSPIAIDVVRSDINIGGAGGFALGMSRALQGGGDWMWLMDDDAIADPQALSALVRQITTLPASIGALCCCVMEFGTIALQHRRWFDPIFGFERQLPKSLYRHTAVKVDTASFVGFLVSARAVRAVGLPNTDFFLAYDDTEYSLRLGRHGFDIWLAPASVVFHKRAARERMRSSAFGRKHYFNIRNRIFVKRMYCQASIAGGTLGALFGVMLWLRAPGSRASWRLLVRSVADGFSGRLGPLGERSHGRVES